MQHPNIEARLCVLMIHNLPVEMGTEEVSVTWAGRGREEGSGGWWEGGVTVPAGTSKSLPSYSLSESLL